MLILPVIMLLHLLWWYLMNRKPTTISLSHIGDWEANRHNPFAELWEQTKEAWPVIWFGLWVFVFPVLIYKIVTLF